MTIGSNQLVQIADYNTIQTKVATVLGVGSGKYGYGQTVNSLQVFENSIVSQSDWDKLRYDLVNVNIHQSGSAYSATTNASNSSVLNKLQFLTSTVSFLKIGMAVFGIGSTHPIQTFKYITAITTSGTNTIITLNSNTESTVPSGTIINFGTSSLSDFAEGELLSSLQVVAYQTLSDNLYADTIRFTIGNGQSTTTSKTTKTRTWSSSTNPTYWNSVVSAELTVSFDNANQARYFFNSGGEIIITSSRSSGASNTQNTNWTNLLNTAGAQSLGAQIPSTVNFYSLTNVYQTYFQVNGTGSYSSNYYKLEARSNIENNNNGTASIVYIKITFFNGDSLTIDGTLSISVSEKKAEGKLLPSGNFSIVGPNYTISDITSTIVKVGYDVYIAVVDESSTTSISSNATLWQQFRNKKPTALFYLLQPVATLNPTLLKIPTNFDGTIIRVNRDLGVINNKSDWFQLCNISQMTPGISIGLAIDNSGSMSTDTVRASYDYFIQQLNTNQFSHFLINMGTTEDWITWAINN